MGDALRAALEEVNGVEALFIYGSTAKNFDEPQSDIDLLVIGAPDEKVLDDALSSVEASVKRQVSPSVFTREEAIARIEAGDPFLTSVLEGDRVRLSGEVESILRTRT